MGIIRDLIRSIWRDFEVDGVASSGARKVRKRDIRALGDTLDAAIAALAKLNAIGPIDVIKPGLSALNADLAHSSGTLAAIISTNEEVAGIYEKSGGSGSGSWTLRMLFTTVPSAEFADVVAAAAEVDALKGRSNYVAASISGTPDALVITTGYDIDALEAGMTVSFRATPGPNTSSTVTIDLDGTGPEPVKRGNGKDPRPGDLLGKQWQQTVEWTGNAWRLISSSQVVEVAEAVELRDDDGILFADGNDVVAGELEPSGALAMPAILTEAVGGVSTGYLRRQQLPGVVEHLPLAVGNFVYGQSNALANKAAVLSTLRSARNMRMFNAGVRAFAGSGTPSENRERLVPHVEAFVAEVGPTPDRGETSCFGSAEAFCDLIEAEQGWGDYASTVMVISAASGEGSTTIAQLLDDEPLDRFILDVEAAGAFALSETGRKLVAPSLLFNEIEAEVAAEKAPATWKTEMIAAQAIVEDRMNVALGYSTGTGPTIPWIIPQVASWNYYAKTGALAVAAVELCQASDKFILLPSHMLEFPDDVHYTAEGHHGIVGPRVGYINKRLAINGQARSTFAPTVPISNDREGRFAWFQFHTWAGDPLTVDTRLVTKVANFGLEGFASNGTTPRTINKVHVLPTELVIEYAANPVAGDILRNGLSGTGTGWNAGPRSNLRTTHGDHVTVRTMQGVKPVHEWVPAFSYTLT